MVRMVCTITLPISGVIMIRRYEMLILATPEITQDEMSELEKLFDKKVQEYKGEVASFDKWGKYLLAYPVNGREYGVYFLARFTLPSDAVVEAIKEVKSLLELKFNACVMRYMASVLAPDVPTTYKRPLSLEEAPREVVQFMKEGRGGYHRDRGDREPRERGYGAPQHARAGQTEVAPVKSEEEEHGQES